MTSGHAREIVPSSSSEGETSNGPQDGKGISVVLIDRQTLTRHCLSRSFQERLPDLRVVAVANLADLLDASRSLRGIFFGSDGLQHRRYVGERCRSARPDYLAAAAHAERPVGAVV